VSPPVRVPHSPRGYGWVVRSEAAEDTYLKADGYWGPLWQAKVYRTHDEASRTPGRGHVFSMALSRELVGEREGRA
jgi:hypothetical protein